MEPPVQFAQPCYVLIDPLCPTSPRLLFLSSDHNRQILQHILPREISTESFTHLLFLLCPLSSSVSPVLYTLSLSAPRYPFPLSLSQLFFIFFLLQVQSQSGES